MDEATATAHSEHPPGERGGYEHRDVVFRPIVRAGLGLFAATIGVFVFMLWLFGYFAAREAQLSPAVNPLAGSYGRQLPPEPRLQTAPIQDLRQLHAAEDAVLHAYGWVDRGAGTVRIPIERAMELLAQRGLPARSDGAPPSETEP